MPKQTTLIPEKETPDQEQRAVAVRSNGAANQNTLRNIGLIIGREYKNRITQRSFIISTLIILVLLVIGVCVPTFIQYFTSKSNTQTKMAVINNANTVAGLRGEALTHYIETNLNGAVASSTT